MQREVGGVRFTIMPCICLELTFFLPFVFGISHGIPRSSLCANFVQIFPLKVCGTSLDSTLPPWMQPFFFFLFCMDQHIAFFTHHCYLMFGSLYLHLSRTFVLDFFPCALVWRRSQFIFLSHIPRMLVDAPDFLTLELGRMWLYTFENVMKSYYKTNIIIKATLHYMIGQEARDNALYIGPWRCEGPKKF